MYQSLALSQPPDLGLRVTAAARDIAARADALQHLDDDALPCILALLATGAFTAAARLVRRLAPTAEPRALAAAVGRYSAWSGDLDTLASLRHHGLRLLDAPDQHPGSGLAAVITAGALAAVERNATDLADPATAARAHAALRTVRTVLTAATTGEPARLLAESMGLDPGTPPATSHAGPASPLPDAAEWLVLHVVHRLLAVDPDATRHRLRLRPALHVASYHDGPALPLRLEGLAFGDGSMSLEITAGADGALTYRLEQDSGSIPATALLEPLLPFRPRAVEVDGRPAELRPRQHVLGVILPVQLVLDAPRELKVWIDEGRPPE